MKKESLWPRLTVVGTALIIVLTTYLSAGYLNEAWNRYLVSPAAPYEKDIPLVAEMVISYLSIYFFFTAPVWHFQKIPFAELLRFSETLLASYLLTYLLNFSFPTENPHAGIQPPDNIFGSALAFLYLEGGKSAFPSTHTMGTLITLAFLKPAGRIWYWLYLPWGAAIIASTLLLKQHFIADVAAGMILAPLVIAGTRRWLAASCRMKRTNCRILSFFNQKTSDSP